MGAKRCSPGGPSIKRYDSDGALTEWVTYAVEKVALRPDLPEDFFVFKAPPGYAVHDGRGAQKPGPSPAETK